MFQRRTIVNVTPEKIGVIAALISTVMVVVPILDLAMGNCFFEQGCGRNEGLMLAGVFAASCLVGCIIGLGAMFATKVIIKNGQE
jgi:hypothetical protein